MNLHVIILHIIKYTKKVQAVKHKYFNCLK